MPDRPMRGPGSSEGSIASLLAGVTWREPLVADDGKSGNTLERVEIDGTRYVVKHQSVEADWIMRVTGDRVFWPHRLWRGGLLDHVPPTIDHAVVAMAVDGQGPGAQLAILMRDVGASLIPEGDDPVPAEVHEGLIDDMAALHAAFWGWHDELGLQTMPQRLAMFAPATIAPELRVAGSPDAVPVPIRVADQGWRRLPEVAPGLAALVMPFHDDPTPLIGALASTPATFVHGDWKMGNLGRHDDGRTVLLDWAYPGEAPGCWDLMWYLALNRARLPQSKEQSSARYRTGLEAAGIDTSGWWERQLGLSSIAMMVVFGWEKAVGDADELAWWEQHALEASRFLP
ncbi:MAG: phosphotransferase [Acidimicrobiales bacterium]